MEALWRALRKALKKVLSKQACRHEIRGHSVRAMGLVQCVMIRIYGILT